MNFAKCFFSIDWYDHGNCFPLWSVYIMDHIDWIWILSQLYLHNKKPMCLWCIIPFIYCWILFDNILLRNVASIFMRDTGLYFFFFLISVVFVMVKAMAPHSSTFSWKIPWTEEHGRLQSMGSLRVGHDWRDLATAAAAALTRHSINNSSHSNNNKSKVLIIKWINATRK